MSVCTICGETAKFAVHTLISTNGISPRRQKCSRAVPFCNACMQCLCTSNGVLLAPAISTALSTAYAAVTSVSTSPSEQDSSR